MVIVPVMGPVTAEKPLEDITGPDLKKEKTQHIFPTLGSPTSPVQCVHSPTINLRLTDESSPPTLATVRVMTFLIKINLIVCHLQNTYLQQHSPHLTFRSNTRFQKALWQPRFIKDLTTTFCFLFRCSCFPLSHSPLSFFSSSSFFLHESHSQLGVLPVLYTKLTLLGTLPTTRSLLDAELAGRGQEKQVKYCSQQARPGRRLHVARGSMQDPCRQSSHTLCKNKDDPLLLLPAAIHGPFHTSNIGTTLSQIFCPAASKPD